MNTKPSPSLPTHKVLLLQTLYQGLQHTLDRTDLDELGKKYEGKVRDNYSTPDGRRFIVVTDRISAFDRVLGTIPYKGQLLTRMAQYWFNKTRDIAPNHMIAMRDPNVMECVECRPLPVEMVVRGYITGVTSTSIWTHYKDGKREFCGHRLPDNLKKNDKLPQPILTPSTKAEKGGHDISASRDEILALTKMPAEHFDAAAKLATALFTAGQAHARSRGLILVDTKYEFGLAPDGRVMVIDEIHTPDSSRYWFAESYADRHARGEEPESFDKEYVRRWLAEAGYTGDGDAPKIPDEIRVEAARRYIEAYERITGELFVPDDSSPLERIRRNLGLTQ